LLLEASFKLCFANGGSLTFLMLKIVVFVIFLNTQSRNFTTKSLLKFAENLVWKTNE